MNRIKKIVRWLIRWDVYPTKFDDRDLDKSAKPPETVPQPWKDSGQGGEQYEGVEFKKQF